MEAPAATAAASIRSESLGAVVASNSRLVSDIRGQFNDIAMLASVASRGRRLDQEVPDLMSPTVGVYGTIAAGAPTPRRRPPPAPPAIGGGVGGADGGVRALQSIVVSFRNHAPHRIG